MWVTMGTGGGMKLLHAIRVILVLIVELCTIKDIYTLPFGLVWFIGLARNKVSSCHRLVSEVKN